MALIPLTQSKVAIVDDGDLALVSRCSSWRAKYRHGTWYAYGYGGYNPVAKRGIDIPLHHLIMDVVGQGKRVDHRDGDGLNNRRKNLREATIGQNRMNARKRMKATSPYKGVHWNTEERKWYAIIKKDKKRKWLGGFQNQIEAAKAYDRAAKNMFGEFACLNFPKRWDG